MSEDLAKTKKVTMPIGDEPKAEPIDRRLEIEEIAIRRSEIPMSIHEAFWRHKRWGSGKLITEEDYMDEFRKFREVF